MIFEDVINFLKETPPYQFLDEKTLKEITGSLSMEFYPRETVILKQDGPASSVLRIIKKGAVKILLRSEGGDDVVIDYMGEGDSFGFLSLIGKGRQRTTIVAVEDTICYMLSKEWVLKLLEASPAFSEYFMFSLSRYVDRIYTELQGKNLFYGSSDRILFTTKAGDAANKVVTAGEDITIREAARIMTVNKISSLLLLNKKNIPAGIVTDRDMREKVIAKGRSISEPVRNIMTISLIRVDSRDSCFEAVLKMIQYNIHHMLVIEDGALKGIMTNHDLMLLQGTSPLSFVNDIENQRTIEGLVPVSQKINNMVGLLLDEGAKASNITRIISEINDRLIRKVLEITERNYGHSPVPYCWIVFGSEGRREQTFKTDQDNAVIYADPASAEEEEEARSYFPGFTSSAIDNILKIGFPMCPAGYMASNPHWCQPLKVWKKKFYDWTAEPAPEAILKSLIFFDFRPLYGKFSLAEELDDYLKSILAGQGIFLGHMANTIIKNTPPIGFFKSFVVEKSGEHKNEFNLKLKGVSPITDIVRFFALEKGVRERSTIGRLNALKDKHAAIRQYSDELEHAFDFIMLLRVRHQLEQIKAGLGPDNFINPDNLGSIEKKTIKDAFHLISKLQGFIAEAYRPMIR